MLIKVIIVTYRRDDGDVIPPCHVQGNLEDKIVVGKTQENTFGGKGVQSSVELVSAPKPLSPKQSAKKMRQWRVFGSKFISLFRNGAIYFEIIVFPYGRKVFVSIHSSRLYSFTQPLTQ